MLGLLVSLGRKNGYILEYISRRIKVGRVKEARRGGPIEVRFDPGIEGARAFGSVRFVRRYIYSLICGLGHTLRATGIFTWPVRVSGASRKSPAFAPCVPRHGGRNERIFMRALNERPMYLCVVSVYPVP